MKHLPQPPTSDSVVKSMRSNKRKDTSPELSVRKALRDAGYPGYRLQWKVPGRPDICYPGRKVAVFVNGCFWHRCPFCNLPIPKHNSDFWRDKFEKNVARDKKNIGILEDQGWTVVVLWECQIKSDLDSAICRVVDEL